MKLNSTRSVKGPDRSERMAIADSRLRIVAPAAGARFAPGDIVNLTVELTPPLAANDISVVVAGWTRLEGTNYAGNTYQASFLIPNFFAGPLRFVPEITDLNNVPVVGPELVVSVQPGPPIAIALLESTLVVTPPLPARRQLYLNGEFADGISRDLTSAAAGTTYVSNNPTVLSVSPDGLCQLAVPGTAVVTVQNGGQTTFAAFLVENPSNPLAPENLTAGVVVQRSGFRLDRTTGFFVQDLTLANVSGVPLMGPLYLVVSGLPSGVSLVNREGTTETISPAGSAFFRVPLSGSGLFMPPGANVPLQLRFLNPNRVNIDYTLSVFRYSAVP